MSEEAAEGQITIVKGGRKTLKDRLKPLIGIGLLVVVFWFLPLGGRLTWTSSDGSEVIVPGVVEGEWRGNDIAFQPDDDWAPEELVPPALVGWQAGDEAVQVTRDTTSDGTGGQYIWTPSVMRIFRDLDLSYMGLTLLLFFLGNCIVVTRWWLLLKGIKLRSTWFNCFRLNFLGLFFNTIVPGLTGGDLVKTIIVVRESPGRRTDAFVSVIVDRLLGLIALASIAVVVVFLVPGFEDLMLSVGLFLIATVVGATIYFSQTLRKLVRFEALLAKLPMGDKIKLIDDAVMLYSQHKPTIALALLLSLGNHFIYINGVFCLGLACGVPITEVSWDQYFVIVPIANIITALPTSPGGLGVGEALYVWLFGMIDARGSLGIAVSLTFRVCQMLLGLLGGIFLLLPGARDEIYNARNQ
ncbi:MAG: hypothetical protein ACI8TQ_002344 [Planctomycetota bacterium]